MNEQIQRDAERMAIAVEIRPDSWTAQNTSDPELMSRIEQEDVSKWIRAVPSLVTALVAQAVADERGRCEAIAERHKVEQNELIDEGDDRAVRGARIAHEIAAAIRAPGSPIPTPGAGGEGGEKRDE